MMICNSVCLVFFAVDRSPCERIRGRRVGDRFNSRCNASTHRCCRSGWRLPHRLSSSVAPLAVAAESERGAVRGAADLRCGVLARVLAFGVENLSGTGLQCARNELSSNGAALYRDTCSQASQLLETETVEFSSKEVTQLVSSQSSPCEALTGCETSHDKFFFVPVCLDLSISHSGRSVQPATFKTFCRRIALFQPSKTSRL